MGQATKRIQIDNSKKTTFINKFHSVSATLSANVGTLVIFIVESPALVRFFRHLSLEYRSNA